MQSLYKYVHFKIKHEKQEQLKRNHDGGKQMYSDVTVVLSQQNIKK